VVLLEWMVAQVLGLFISAAAVSLLMHQMGLGFQAVQRQWQAQDLGALTELIRAELRMAGHRYTHGAEPAYDRLGHEALGRNAIEYRCDACGSSHRTLPAALRLSQQVLSHRRPGSPVFQPLNDPRLLALSTMSLTEGVRGDCTPWVTVRLIAASTHRGLSASESVWVVAVRPRNLGLQPCEWSDAQARR
jgi:hypothetical protein